VTTSLNKKNVDVAHFQEKIHATLGCLGRPRHRQWDNTKMDLTGTGRQDVEWSHMAQGRDQE
jgi:hypothetical protein